jgi:hypothetical protein
MQFVLGLVGFVTTLATLAAFSVLILSGVVLTMPESLREYIGATNEVSEKTTVLFTISKVIGYIFIGLGALGALSTIIGFFGMGNAM